MHGRNVGLDRFVSYFVPEVRLSFRHGVLGNRLVECQFRRDFRESVEFRAAFVAKSGSFRAPEVEFREVPDVVCYVISGTICVSEQQEKHDFVRKMCWDLTESVLYHMDYLFLTHLDSNSVWSN